MARKNYRLITSEQLVKTNPYTYQPPNDKDFYLDSVFTKVAVLVEDLTIKKQERIWCKVMYSYGNLYELRIVDEPRFSKFHHLLFGDGLIVQKCEIVNIKEHYELPF